MTDILPGAEPWSADGGPSGALCIHGFTGNPGSMRGVAEAFAAAGFAVELPLLPGHGTTVEEMKATMDRLDGRWRRRTSACRRGPTRSSSPGSRWAGASLWTALQHPEVAGIVCINPATQPQPAELMEMLHGMVSDGVDHIPGIGADIADPDATESAHDGRPWSR